MSAVEHGLETACHSKPKTQLIFPDSSSFLKASEVLKFRCFNYEVTIFTGFDRLASLLYLKVSPLILLHLEASSLLMVGGP